MAAQCCVHTCIVFSQNHVVNFLGHFEHCFQNFTAVLAGSLVCIIAVVNALCYGHQVSDALVKRSSIVSIVYTVEILACLVKNTGGWCCIHSQEPGLCYRSRWVGTVFVKHVTRHNLVCLCAMPCLHHLLYIHTATFSTTPGTAAPRPHRTDPNDPWGGFGGVYRSGERTHVHLVYCKVQQLKHYREKVIALQNIVASSFMSRWHGSRA